MGEVATLTVSTVAAAAASQKKRALTAWARRSARLMDGGQTLGGDTSGTWRTEGVASGGDEAFRVFGTSTSGGTHSAPTERRWGARSGAELVLEPGHDAPVGDLWLKPQPEKLVYI